MYGCAVGRASYKQTPQSQFPPRLLLSSLRDWAVKYFIHVMRIPKASSVSTMLTYRLHSGAACEATFTLLLRAPVAG